MDRPGPLVVFRRVLRRERVRALGRRYFVSNAFDGTLTSIGIIIGGYLSGVEDGRTMIAIGLGAAVGLGISGIWSVWEIERAEMGRKREELEQAMLTELDDTRIQREYRYIQSVLAFLTAGGPVLAILVTLIPFLFVGLWLSIVQAVLVSIALGVLLLGAVGAYMGKISHQQWWIAAVRMAVAGLVVAIISIFLPK